MDNTHIIRRIDDLGRIVIPREIRMSLRIKEGDAFELSVDADTRTVSFTKVSACPGTIAQEVLRALQAQFPKARFSVIDNDHNVVAGREILEKDQSNVFEAITKVAQRMDIVSPPEMAKVENVVVMYIAGKSSGYFVGVIPKNTGDVLPAMQVAARVIANDI